VLLVDRSAIGVGGELDRIGAILECALGFTLGISLACTLLFGLAPAVHFSRPALRSALSDGTRGSGTSLKRHRLRNGVVIAEVGLALVLLVGAGLIIKSFWRLSSVDPGFRTERVLSFQLSLPGSTYAEGEPQVRFFTRTIDAGARCPASNRRAATGGRSGCRHHFDRRSACSAEGEALVADVRAVTPDLFTTLRIQLDADPLDGDAAGAPAW
jgi:hypothetical protein